MEGKCCGSCNKTILTVQELSVYASISKSYIYHLTSSGKLKCYKPFDKIYFKREEVDEFLLSNPVASDKDVEARVSRYFLKSKR